MTGQLYCKKKENEGYNDDEADDDVDGLMHVGNGDGSNADD